MSDDVSGFVDLASLHEGPSAEVAAERRAQTLAALDDEEPRAVRREPTRDEVVEHGLARDLVLRRAFPESGNMLCARRVDAERAEHDVLAEVNIGDEDGSDVEVTERMRDPLGELVPRPRDEASPCGALACAARLDVVG
jgi:hypothetical protein